MKESGRSGVLFVGFAFGRMPELAPHGLIEGLVSREELSGVRRKSIFQISHEAIGSTIEGVDNHFRVGGACDFYMTFLKGSGEGSHLPLACTDGLSSGMRRRKALRPNREQSLPPRPKPRFYASEKVLKGRSFQKF
jgi:hypothetical protein